MSGASASPGCIALRTLERDEWLESRWTTSAAGPPRRLYRLTPEGRRNLDQLAATITATRDTHAAFLRACTGCGRGPRQSAPDEPARPTNLNRSPFGDACAADRPGSRSGVAVGDT